MSKGTKNTRAPDRRNGRRERPASSGHGGGAKRPAHQGDARAHAKRNYERYIELARAAVQAGDEIEGENFYQHAEHYFRSMKEPERGHDEDGGRRDPRS
jgi:Domain of unknown function (DUF4167)